MWVKTPIYESEVEGEPVVVFGLAQPVISPHPSDISFTVPISGVARFDLISQHFYGVPDLGHVIASVNNTIDMLVGVPVGTRIRVPTKARLAQEGLLSV